MRRAKKSYSYYSPASALADVKAIYEELSQRPIERHCTLKTECCHFLQTGKTPFLTRGEALLAAQALGNTGRKELPKRIDGACKLLHPRTNRCMIYQDRPFGCRTHFCQAAGGPYARKEVVDLIHRLEEIDRKLEGQGSQELHTAIEEVLKEQRH
ncbi:MAG: YkgJ family cysteine cluster protein [Chthoniobacterales bacterium]|nr:YkgJ family cysteine cluster protein [Chthoniobacterales bacterium]